MMLAGIRVVLATILVSGYFYEFDGFLRFGTYFGLSPRALLKLGHSVGLRISRVGFLTT